MLAEARDKDDAFDAAAAGGGSASAGIVMAQSDTPPVAPIAVVKTRNAWHSDGNVRETEDSGPNEQSAHTYESSQERDGESSEEFPTENEPDNSPIGAKTGCPHVGPSAVTVSSSPRVVRAEVVEGRLPAVCGRILVRSISVGNGAGKRAAAVNECKPFAKRKSCENNTTHW